jgi:hypothetical protein
MDHLRSEAITMTPYINHSKQEQGLFLPPSLRDWPTESDLVWFVIDVVKSLGLKPLYASLFDNGEKACVRDIVFRLICGTKTVEARP